MSGLYPKKTLVPFDFSDLSLAAVDRAIEIAGNEGAVEVIYVLTELLALQPGDPFGTMSDDDRIEAAMEQLRETFSAAKYAKIKFHVATGNFGREIASFAQREKINLIVIPSHGYGFVKHVLLGSVAERVVCLAHCPVLVLRS